MKEGKKELYNDIATDESEKEKVSNNNFIEDCNICESNETVPDEKKKRSEQESEQKEEQKVGALKKQLDEITEKSEEYLNMLHRTAAEFDNYKKRTQKEKESIRKETICDVVAAFIMVADNLERALKSTENKCDYKTVREGIELVYKQFNEILKNLGVKEIKCVGEKFDPNLHNAVMHISDKDYGESEVIEEFQRGYVMEDRVIRHSVVKVAN